jgi:hypothetical protein
MKLLLVASLVSLTALHAAPPSLSKIASRADLDTVIAASKDAVLKQALQDNAAAILSAAEQHPHVEAVTRTIESAPGTFTKINTTPEALKKAAGGDIAIFDTLTMVNTGILNGHAHASRDKTTDPYDAVFIEHLGRISSLESLSLVVTTFDEASLDPILKLNRLKSLRIEKRYDNGPGDAALAKLSQLANFPDLKSLSPALLQQGHRRRTRTSRRAQESRELQPPSKPAGPCLRQVRGVDEPQVHRLSRQRHRR